MSDTLNALNDRLCELQGLTENWDGYGGKPPAEQVPENAWELIVAVDVFGGALPSELTPTPYGTITITWEAEGAEAAIEVGQTRYVGYCERSGRTPAFVSGLIEDLHNETNHKDLLGFVE